MHHDIIKTGADIDRDHLFFGRHHFFYKRAAEIEDPGEHARLFLVQDPLLLPHLYERPYLFRRYVS